MKDRLNVTINGAKMELEVDTCMSVLDLLRNQLLLTGTKKGCGEGDCGACTVIMNGKAVKTCILPVMKAQDAEIETIENLCQDNKLHPLQQNFIDKGAVQCGFCTPGMIMTAKALLKENPNPTDDELKQGMAGNICRCTGYVKILDAVQSAAKEMREGVK